ncbi:response regulator [Parabacteroides sp. OttesenSCG-928-N08]|nr:response regulator [Parabacteroides sp. OttesenSCG-928-N08]
MSPELSYSVPLEDRLRALVDSLPGFVFVIDTSFVLRDVMMPESMKLFHSMKELIGMDAHLIYSPSVSELIKKNMEHCLQDGQMREMEYPVDLKGLRFYYQARMVPYSDTMVLLNIQDIGDRVRRIEELVESRKREETNRLKSTFLANMSHEIRTPLNAIVGFSELLAEEEFAENKEEFLDVIRSNSELLLRLINDILDISRIESGRIEVVYKETDLNSLVREVEDIHRLKMKPNIAFHVTQPDGNLHIDIDPNRVKQILNNFLSNAIKHTVEGSITLDVELIDEDKLKFSVTDTGTGIEEDKLNAVFDRFEKLNTFAQGTGLGLSISKSLIENMRGEIGVTSQVGVGSTFYFIIPRWGRREDLCVVTESSNNSSKETETSQKRQILVLEQNDTDYDFISEVLSSRYRLLRTMIDDEVVKLLLSEKPDLLLLDISNEEINGRELLEKIRDVSSEIPIVIITEQGNYFDQEIGLKYGANDIVLKPCSSSLLKEAIVPYV